MPLSIELNHVLGRRTLALPYRDSAAPAKVGRSRDCEVQIPAVGVGATHCVLFVRDGQWVVRESPSCPVTVNGSPVAGPTPLQIGDVIGIGEGEKAPTIRIDPAGADAGKTGPAREAAPPPAQAPAAAAAVARTNPRAIRPPKPTPVAGQAPPQIKPKSPPRIRELRPVAPQPPPQQEYEPEVQEPQAEPEEYAPAYEESADYADAEAPAAHEPVEDGDTIDLGQAATGGFSYGRRRKKAGSGVGAMLLVFLVLIGGLGAVIYWAWQKHQANLALLQQQQSDDKPAQPTVIVEAPTSRPKPIIDNTIDVGTSIFGVPQQRAAKPPKPSPPSAPASPSDTSSAGPAGPATPPAPPAPTTPTPPATPPDQAPATNPADDTASADDDNSDDWQLIRAAHIGPDQANAIVKYDSYRHSNPGKHTKDLERFDNEAMEQLWWQRVVDLFNRRADLDKQIADQKKEMSQQPDDSFKKKMQADLTDLQQKRKAVDEELTVKLAYTLPTPPDVDDPDALAQLDATRDPQKFEEWKKVTLPWIREHNGKTPWADE